MLFRSPPHRTILPFTAPRTPPASHAALSSGPFQARPPALPPQKLTQKHTQTVWTSATGQLHRHFSQALVLCLSCSLLFPTSTSALFPVLSSTEKFNSDPLQSHPQFDCVTIWGLSPVLAHQLLVASGPYSPSSFPSFSLLLQFLPLLATVLVVLPVIIDEV